MTFAVIGVIVFASAADRDAAAADVTNFLAGKPRFGVDTVASGATRLGENSLRLELRLVAKSDQTALMTRLDTFLVGSRTPLPGSWVTIHDCPHDQPAPPPCVAGATRTW